MKDHHLLYRRVLLISSLIFVVVAVILAIGVIPPVRADTYPGVDHDKVTKVFLVIIGLHLLIAFAVFSIAKRALGAYRSALFAIGLFVIIIGLILADGASAYQDHGPTMQAASILLFICTAIDCLAGMTVIITGFQKPLQLNTE